MILLMLLLLESKRSRSRKGCAVLLNGSGGSPPIAALVSGRAPQNAIGLFDHFVSRHVHGRHLDGHGNFTIRNGCCRGVGPLAFVRIKQLGGARLVWRSSMPCRQQCRDDPESAVGLLDTAALRIEGLTPEQVPIRGRGPCGVRRQSEAATALWLPAEPVRRSCF